MKCSRGFLAITALLVMGLCVLVYRAVYTTDEGPPEAITAHADQPPGAAAELAALRREMARLELQVRAQDRRLASTSARAEASAPAATEDVRTDPEARAEEQRRYREYVAGIEAAFRKEVTNPQWSSVASSAIQTAIAGDDDLRALARGVECRSSTCRVEIADEGSSKLGKALPMLAHRVGQELPHVVAERVENEGGAATMVLYLSRQSE